MYINRNKKSSLKRKNYLLCLRDGYSCTYVWINILSFQFFDLQILFNFLLFPIIPFVFYFAFTFLFILARMGCKAMHKHSSHSLMWAHSLFIFFHWKQQPSHIVHTGRISQVNTLRVRLWVRKLIMTFFSSQFEIRINNNYFPLYFYVLCSIRCKLFDFPCWTRTQGKW